MIARWSPLTGLVLAFFGLLLSAWIGGCEVPPDEDKSGVAVDCFGSCPADRPGAICCYRPDFPSPPPHSEGWCVSQAVCDAPLTESEQPCACDITFDVINLTRSVCVTEDDCRDALGFGEGGATGTGGMGTAGGSDAGGNGAGGDASGGAGGTGGAPPSTTGRVRLVHGAADEVALDVCLFDVGANAYLDAAPILQASDADGLNYLEASPYLSLRTGTYRIDLVDGSASGCSIVRLTGPTFTLSDSGDHTLFVTGLIASSSVTVVALDDTLPTIPSGTGLIRFVHGLSGVAPADAGIRPINSVLEAGDVTYDDIAFATASAYVPFDPTAGQTFRVQDAATATLGSNFEAFAVTAGEAKTFFAMGTPTNPLPRLLLCLDNVGDGSSCTFLTGYN